MKEVEIIEYPGNSKFMAYKTRKIENKVIPISRTGVYAFRLKNSNIFGRVCRIKIDRIPASDKTRAFNSAVRWIERADTTWNIYTKDIVAGYDTLLLYKIKKELVKTEITEDLFMNKDQRVSSRSNANGNKTAVFFTIPTYLSTEFVRKRVTAMAYWVGVGEEANKQWEKNTKAIRGMAVGAGAFSSPLGALAAGAIADIALPSIGEDVYYALVDEQNRDLFFAGSTYLVHDEGKGIAGFKKFTDPRLMRGTWHVVLSNDNYMLGINVTVKVSAIVQTSYYKDVPYTEQKITPRYENKTFRTPVVAISKVPVNMK